MSKGLASVIVDLSWEKGILEAKVKSLAKQLEKAHETEDKLNRALKALDTLVPIVDEAFWDHHTAGTMLGSGYSHKVYTLIGKIFDWRTPSNWNRFKKSVESLKDKKMSNIYPNLKEASKQKCWSCESPVFQLAICACGARQ